MPKSNAERAIAGEVIFSIRVVVRAKPNHTEEDIQRAMIDGAFNGMAGGDYAGGGNSEIDDVQLPYIADDQSEVHAVKFLDPTVLTEKQQADMLTILGFEVQKKGS